MTELILTAELVPSTSWYNNLRKHLAPSDWDWIRQQVYAHYEHRCAICGAAGALDCHEIWHYDDTEHVQTIAGFLALCKWCHHIKHLGFAAVLQSRGELDYERLIRHFMTVNQCSRATFLKHRDEAFDQWEARSRYPWRVDLQEYAVLVKKTHQKV